jgi:hypothetical protein
VKSKPSTPREYCCECSQTRSAISALHVVVERVIGGAHVGKLGVPILFRQHPGVEQRILGWRGLERTVRMPQLVAEAEQPPAILARHDGVALAEVRDIGDFRGEPTVLVAAHIGVGDLERAEIAAEGELLRIVDPLVAEDEHGERVHALDDRGDLLGGHRRAQIDAGYLAGEERTVDRIDRAEGEGHRFATPAAGQAKTIVRLPFPVILAKPQ